MWITLSIILSLLILILLPLLLPTQLVIKSKTKNYGIRIPYYFKLNVQPDEEIFHVRGRLFFIPFRFGVEDFFKNEKDMSWPLQEGYRIKRVTLKVRDGWKAVKEVFQAITVHHFYANVDTGDFPLNAKIIPLASVLQRPNIAIQVNFVNHVMVDALIYTRLYKIIWIIFKNLKTQK